MNLRTIKMHINLVATSTTMGMSGAVLSHRSAYRYDKLLCMSIAWLNSTNILTRKRLHVARLLEVKAYRPWILEGTMSGVVVSCSNFISRTESKIMRTITMISLSLIATPTMSLLSIFYRIRAVWVNSERSSRSRPRKPRRARRARCGICVSCSSILWPVITNRYLCCWISAARELGEVYARDGGIGVFEFLGGARSKGRMFVFGVW